MADIRSQREQGAGKPASAKDDFFNFSAEVMSEVEDAVVIPAPTTAPRSRYAPEGDFSQFKKGVEEQIGSEDAETHFNLGIAYREMGLINDAIGEFNHAMKDPARRFDCLTLKGICLLDKKDFEGAEASFKLGLSTSDLAENQKLSLFYELGLLYEAWDRPLDALDSFQSAADVDLFFRNVREKIQELRNRLGMEDGDNGDSNAGNGSKDRVSYV
jgi:tetratricopeptide (TPR) repeat protein